MLGLQIPEQRFQHKLLLQIHKQPEHQRQPHQHSIIPVLRPKIFHIKQRYSRSRYHTYQYCIDKYDEEHKHEDPVGIEWSFPRVVDTEGKDTEEVHEVGDLEDAAGFGCVEEEAVVLDEVPGVVVLGAGVGPVVDHVAERGVGHDEQGEDLAAELEPEHDEN